MDFLKAEIERKKRQIQEKNVLQPQKKYFKRGDLAAVQEAEYLSKFGPNKEDIEELERKKSEALEDKGEHFQTILQINLTLKLLSFRSFRRKRRRCH